MTLDLNREIAEAIDRQWARWTVRISDDGKRWDIWHREGPDADSYEWLMESWATEVGAEAAMAKKRGKYVARAAMARLAKVLRDADDAADWRKAIEDAANDRLDIAVLS